MNIKETLKKGLKTFFTFKPKRFTETKTSVAVLLAVLIPVTQALDFFSTKVGLTLGATEANPLMATVIAGSGISLMGLIKALSSVFLIWFTWKRPVAALVIVTLFSVITLSNLVVITLLLAAS